jgi:Rrf2 family protein
MKLTQETDYAFRLVFAFSRLKPGCHLTAREIADSQNIPYRFLLRVIAKLKKEGIVASRQGVDGGYRLGRPRSEITLKDVMEAIEGPVNINRCLKSSSLCTGDFAAVCRVHRALAEVQDKLLQDLHSYNFENMQAP